MPLLTIEQARQQVNLLPDETEFDTYLTQLSKAAEKHIARRIRDENDNIAVFVDDAVALAAMEEPPANPIIVAESDDLVLAAALLVGHWFNNREAVSDVSMQEVPQAFESLIFDYTPHRIG